MQETERQLAPGPNRREQILELLVFLFLIVPSMVLSFFAVKQGSVGFVLTAVATIFRDLALIALLVFFLWRNGERIDAIGWTWRKGWLDVLLGIVFFPAMLFGAIWLERVLRSLGLTAPSTPQPSLTPEIDALHMMLAVILVTVVAVSEETIFRGYLILRLRSLVGGVGWAIVLSAFVFSLGHGYEGTAGAITVGAMGVVFALAFAWRKSLIMPITMHFLQDLLSIVLSPLVTGRQ